MLVVDRRDDEGAYDPGANRAAVQAELAKHAFHPSGLMESNAIPAQVEVESAPISAQADQNRPLNPETSQRGDKAGFKALGIPVLVQTPGPETLLRLMVERIWGVHVP